MKICILTCGLALLIGGSARADLVDTGSGFQFVSGQLLAQKNNFFALAPRQGDTVNVSLSDLTGFSFNWYPGLSTGAGYRFTLSDLLSFSATIQCHGSFCFDDLTSLSLTTIPIHDGAGRHSPEESFTILSLSPDSAFIADASGNPIAVGTVSSTAPEPSSFLLAGATLLALGGLGLFRKHHRAR